MWKSAFEIFLRCMVAKIEIIIWKKNPSPLEKFYILEKIFVLELHKGKKFFLYGALDLYKGKKNFLYEVLGQKFFPNNNFYFRNHTS